MRRTVQAMSTAAWVSLLLIGLPTGLLHVGGSPIPHHAPTSQQLAAFIQQPLTRGSLLYVVELAMWLMWATLLLLVLAECYRLVAQASRHLPHLPPVGPVQGISALMLGTVAVSGTTTATSFAATTRAAVAVDDHPVEHLLGVGPVAVASPVAAQPATPRPQYAVSRGDWLGLIAQRFLGSFNRYPDVAALNPTLIPDRSGPHGPDHIETKWRLVLPADAVDRGPRLHATGTATITIPRPPAAPRGTAPGIGGTPSPRHDPASTCTPHSNRGGPAAAPAPASPSSPPWVADDRSRPGVHLPGGWMPIPLAVAVLSAAAMVWRRRRHRYQPATGAPNPGDADLRPLPPVIATLRRRVRQQGALQAAPAGDAPDPSAPGTAATRPRAGDAAAPAASPITPFGSDLAGPDDRLAATGLGLTGDGAAAAARAMLVAAFSTDNRGGPDGRGQVVAAADTLTALLGGHTPGQIPGLSVTTNLTDALTMVEELLIHRRRLIQDDDLTDLDATPNVGHPAMPRVLLLAEPPNQALATRLATTMQLGGPVNISAVVIGPWTVGPTITVDADGHTDDGQRMAVLDIDTTRQLLAVLREAHTDAEAASAAPHSANSAGDPHADPTGLPPQEEASAETTGQNLAPRADAAATADAPARPDAGPAAAPALGPRVSLRVLGTPAIMSNGAAVAGMRSKALELMVYLAVHRAGANLPDIQEALWPDATVRRAAERLQTEVGDLRGRIRDAAADRSIQPVVNTGGRYHLNPDIVEVDLWILQDALAAAAGVDTDDQRIEHLREAIAADNGELARGRTYDWLPEVEEHVRRCRIVARVQLATRLTSTNPQHAAGLLEEATRIDPYNEDLARRAIRAHAQTRDPQAIRAQLRRLEAALEELGVHADPQTSGLAAMMLRQITGGRPTLSDEDACDP